jgi:hypothetical protein
VYVIVVVPLLIGATIPVELPTVATKGTELLQEPPVTGFPNVNVGPGQVGTLPVIGEGSGLTVIGLVT